MARTRRQSAQLIPLPAAIANNREVLPLHQRAKASERNRALPEPFRVVYMQKCGHLQQGARGHLGHLRAHQAHLHHEHDKELSALEAAP